MSRKRTLTLYHPATQKFRQTISLASDEDVNEAVRTARHCFDTKDWGHRPIAVRLKILEQLYDALARHREEFAQVISEEVGTPLSYARTQQVDAALAHITATLEASHEMSNDIALDDQGLHRARYEPLGVAALITPWNWPLNQVVLKVAACLMAGCTMVLKPSELTSKTAQLFTDCLAETTLPDGVFHLVIGDSETGRALASHPAIDVISFTGSTAVGREIAGEAAQRFTRTILELGGKSPNILLDDCDIERSVRQGLAHCFRNSGQSCNAASRFIVHVKIYDEVVSEAARVAKNTRPGYPEDMTAQIGPVISARQYERVQSLIKQAVKEGAMLVEGGPGRPEGFNEGYFVKPTVFADVTPQMVLFQTEVFGPVLSITPFETDQQALHLANDTPYGLAAYIQGKSHARINWLTERLRVGMVQVNGSSRIAGAAFGGMKASGIGREAGLWGIRAFQEIKSVSGVVNFDAERQS